MILSVLSDISSSFDHADASSRPLLALAQDENPVQNWLAEQLQLRSKERYSVHREKEVAKKNKPDIIITSTVAPVELAIEIKNVDKGWTLLELEKALKVQLGEDYLLPDNRRCGILVLSQHQRLRTWRAHKKTWQFTDVLNHLSELSKIVVQNKTGSIEVKVFGLDATDRIKKVKPKELRDVIY